MAQRSPCGHMQFLKINWWLIFHHFCPHLKISELFKIERRRWITNLGEKVVLSTVSRRSLSVWHLSVILLMHFKVHQSRARRFHRRHWFLLLLHRPSPACTRASTHATAAQSRPRKAAARCRRRPWRRSIRGWRRRKASGGARPLLRLLLPRLRLTPRHSTSPPKARHDD